MLRSESRHLGDPVQFSVPADYEEEERIDSFIADRLPDVSRTKVQKSIREGLVEVNGTPVKKSYPVEPGDTVRFREIKPPPVGAEPEDIPLDIVFEDEHLIVVNKSAGMVVHPGYGNRSGTLVNALLHHVQSDPLWLADIGEEGLDDEEIGLSTYNALPRNEGNPAVRPGIVHRLDKETSGLLVVAKHDRAHRHLADQFAERSIERKYLCLVWGNPSPAEATVDEPIGRDPSHRKRMAVVREDGGKRAVTHYRTLETHPHTALLEVHLETGRTHQIRVHMLHIGHPVLGDPSYGGKEYHFGAVSRSRRAFFRNLFDVMPRQALHAQTLGFVHPVSEEIMAFSSDLPEDMNHVLRRLRRDAEGMRYH